MRTIGLLAAGLAGAALLSGCGTMGADTKATVYPDKVIYHVNQGDDQAVDALRNIKNHLAVNPKAKIVVVTHSNGVRFLKKGARDKNGNPFNVPVEELKERGVQFDLCEITLQRTKQDAKDYLPEITLVPSGVAEITRLQQREGYAYLRP
jgi:uncharacterized protein